MVVVVVVVYLPRVPSLFPVRKLTWQHHPLHACAVGDGGVLGMHRSAVTWNMHCSFVQFLNKPLDAFETILLYHIFVVMFRAWRHGVGCEFVMVW